MAREVEVLSSRWRKVREEGKLTSIEPPEGTDLPGSPSGTVRDTSGPTEKNVGPARKKAPKLPKTALGNPTDGKPKNTRVPEPPSPAQTEQVKAAQRDKNKPLTEDQKAARRADLAARIASVQEPSSRYPAESTDAEGAPSPEAGRRVSETDYPIPTSRSEAAPLRGMRKHRGGAGTESSEQLHQRLLTNVAKAPAHKVESEKAALHAHINRQGHTEGFPDVCTGPGCKGLIQYNSDDLYCAGDSCATSGEKATPTPRS